jgi:predicted nucleotidyltransferase
VANSTGEDLSGAQLRKIISNYLDEVLRYYKEQQRMALDGPGSEPDQRLEQKAAELLGAMMTSGDPVERRRAVWQVLSQAKQHRETGLPS